MKKDVRDEIAAFLKKEERKLPWLADKTNISYGHLYFIIKKKERRLTEENLSIINFTLGTNFKL